jgi:hypothetical protein
MDDIRKIAPSIALPMSEIINKSFEMGKFPEMIKLAVIIPLYKDKGSKTDASNFRPIAMTSSIAKIFEKCFPNRLQVYFEEKSLLIDHRHGFRKGRRTNTALFDLVNKIYSSIKNRKKVNMIHYDFSYAFGCVVPEILVEKLKRYGLDEKSRSWIKSFLMGRTQKVQLPTWTKLEQKPMFCPKQLTAA